jgi:hypothetical protein
LNKPEFPLPKDNLYQVWLNLAGLVLEKIFFLKFSVFLLFCCYLPIERGNPLHLNKLESPPPKDDLRQVWLEVENVKVYRQTDRRTDRRTTDNTWSE